MLGGGLSLKKKKCKSLRNFIWGTLRLRIGLYLDAFVKVGVRSFLSIADSVFSICTCQLQTLHFSGFHLNVFCTCDS